MKFSRIAALAAAALLAVSCVSCSAGKNNDSSSESSVPESAASSGGENNQIPNPLSEVDSVDDINSRIGCRIKNMESAESESYVVISGETELGQYTFSVDGAEYTLRAAKTTDDISGVYTSDGTLGDTAEPDSITECDDGAYYEKWFDGDMQYSLYGTGTTAADFDTVAFFFKN